MKGYHAFLKKEFLEMLRTYRLLIMVMVFLFFGLMSPIAAKYMPEIANAFLPENIQVELSTPTALDAWAQFFKNMTQIGLIATALIFSGMMSNEYINNTLVSLLSKGLSRKSVVLAKFTASAALWTVCYGLAFVITLVYSLFWWDFTVTIAPLLFSVLCVWVFGIMLLAIEMAGCVAAKSLYGSLLFTCGVLLVMVFTSAFPAIQKYSPVALIMDNMLIVQETAATANYWGALIVAAALGIAFLFLACKHMERKIL